MSTTALRDDVWLESRLMYLWNTYYSEGPAGYPIRVNFGRPARYRFGSIFNQGRKCRILINGVFAHPEVPEYVVDATLAHELAHYVHGYASGLPKLHSNPHRGGVIDKEMQKRGCFYLEEQAGPWRRENWHRFYESHAPASVATEIKSAAKLQDRWLAYLNQPGFRTEEDIARRLEALLPRFGLRIAPFTASWLFASARRTGLSYRFRNETAVRIHAVLAHPSVPKEVVDYELCYWLAAETSGGKWERVEQAMRDAGVWTAASKAIRWRRNVWPRFRAEHLPFN